MSIITSEIYSDTPQANSERTLYYRFIYHDGSEMMHGPCTLQDGADVNAHMALIVPEAEAGRDRRESVLSISRVENGENPLTITLNPVHSTSKNIAKKLIRWMMWERDPYIVLALEPLIDYIRDPSNFTPAQLANWLDVSIATLQKIDARIDYVLNNKADLLAAEVNMEEID